MRYAFPPYSADQPRQSERRLAARNGPSNFGWLDDLLEAGRSCVTITEMFIEPLDRRIVAADEELDLPYAALCQPGLGGIHHHASEAAALVLGVGRDVVDPAAMSVLAEHRCR